MRLKTWTLAAILIAAVTALGGQTPPWSGIIAPSRAIDWSQAGVPGGIPTRTTICATIAPEGSASAPVAPTDINSAIASCPAGQVVYLEPGSYYFSSGIDFHGQSNVTLRGAGADQTILHFVGSLGTDILIVGQDLGANWAGSPSNTANWTAGFSPGTSQITLDNTTNIKPGSTVLILDQPDDTADTGGITVCSVYPTCDNTNNTTSNGRPGRDQLQLVLVRALNGNVVTISPGLYMPNWLPSKSGGSAGAWWSSSGDAVGDGVEDLTIDNSSNSNMSSIAVSLEEAYGSWVSGIRGVAQGRDEIQFGLAAHCTVQNSYFYGSHGSTTTAYGVEEYSGSDNLVLNNIFQHAPVGVVLSGGDEGTVVAYNYDYDCYYASGGANSGGGAWAYMTQCFGSHETGTAMSLWEGNVVNGLAFDDIHGPHALMTVFRNRLFGQEPVENYGNNTVGLEITPLSRFMNVIGNVIGDPGYTTVDEIEYPAGSDSIVQVGLLVGWGVGWSATDALSGTTSMFWGNYGTAAGASSWDPAAVPSTLPSLGNPVPTSEALPPSLFLPSKPAFWVTPWGTPPWPAIGPDVAGGDASVAGHAYQIPAQLCFSNTAVDPAYGSSNVLLFNSGRCYGQPPAPPSSLTATVQ